MQFVSFQNIMKKVVEISYREFESMEELSVSDRELMQHAIAATEAAYAPYSGFHVGAALRLADGSVVVGSNQENAAYPSGLCAERTAVFAASAQHPEMRDYEVLAIAVRDEKGSLCEASPCGACRQVLLEYEQRQGHPMRVLCLLAGGRVREHESVSNLLPFAFQF